jgi:hypothetical protein
MLAAYLAGRISKSGTALPSTVTRSGVLETGIQTPEAGLDAPSHGRSKVMFGESLFSRTS